MVSNSSKIITFIVLAVALIPLVWIYELRDLDQQKISKQVYIENQMLSCYKKKGNNECYEKVAENLLSKYSLPEILRIFEENETKPEFFENCHEVSHYLGQLEYKSLKSVRAVLLESSRGCLGGSYHGAVEGYFMEKGLNDVLGNNIKSEIATICGKPTEYSIPQEFTECNHGLGHALMFTANYDLLNALDLCDALGSENERELCYTGALMANSDSFNNNVHPTKYIKADDPFYPCNILKKHQQKRCYTYGILGRFQDNLSKSIELCLAIPNDFQEECFSTLGRDRTMISSDPENLKSQCLQIRTTIFRKSCISGTAHNLVIRFGIDSNIPIDYCGITDPEFKDTCYAEIFEALRKITLDDDMINNFCLKISDENYRKECLG